MSNLKKQTLIFVEASRVINILLTRMQKVIPPLLTLMIHFTLCNFIFMMRKCKIYSTGMDVQLLSKHCTVTIFSWSVSRTLQKPFVEEMQKRIWWNIISLCGQFHDCSFKTRACTDLGYQNCSRTCMDGTRICPQLILLSRSNYFSNLTKLEKQDISFPCSATVSLSRQLPSSASLTTSKQWTFL